MRKRTLTYSRQCTSTAVLPLGAGDRELVDRAGQDAL